MSFEHRNRSVKVELKVVKVVYDNIKMGTIKLLLLLCLFSAVIAEISPPPVHSAEKEPSESVYAEDTVEFLNSLKQEYLVIRMNSSIYDVLAKSENRKYKIIALFTTLNPERGCRICIPAYHEFLNVVQAFEHDGRKDSYPFKLFFALVDFDESSTIFRRLEIVTAPILLHMSGFRIRAGSFDRLDILSYDITAPKIAYWINKVTGVQIIVSPRLNPLSDEQFFWAIFKVTCAALLLLFIRKIYKIATVNRELQRERPILKPAYRKRARGETFPGENSKFSLDHEERGNIDQPPRELVCKHKRSRHRMTCNF